jgi:hypothetical protein
MQDTVSKDIGGRFPGMVIGPPRTKADTAFVTASRVENNGGVEGPCETGIEHRVERQGGSPASTGSPSAISAPSCMESDSNTDIGALRLAMKRCKSSLTPIPGATGDPRLADG